MTKSSPWPKMLPSLGIALAIALLARGRLRLVERQRHDDGQRRRARRADRRDPSRSRRSRTRPCRAMRRRSTRSRRDRAAITSLRSAVGGQRSGERRRAPVGQRCGAVAAHRAQPRHGARVARSGSQSSRRRAPRSSSSRRSCSSAAGNVASALPPADLTANQPYLSRFELTVESLQQQARALGPTVDVGDSVRRLAGRRAVPRPVRPRLARRGRHARRRSPSRRCGGRRISRPIAALLRASAASDRRDRLRRRDADGGAAAIRGVRRRGGRAARRVTAIPTSRSRPSPATASATRLPLLLVFAALGDRGLDDVRLLPRRAISAAPPSSRPSRTSATSRPSCACSTSCRALPTAI